MNREHGIGRLAGGLCLIAGAWLVISAFLLDYSPARGGIANNLLIGCAVFLLAGIRLGSRDQIWASWCNLVLGLWLIGSPLGLALRPGPPTVNNLILGAIVFLLSVLWLAADRLPPVLGDRAFVGTEPQTQRPRPRKGRKG